MALSNPGEDVKFSVKSGGKSDGKWREIIPSLLHEKQ